jgi:hypothetical protein
MTYVMQLIFIQLIGYGAIALWIRRDERRNGPVYFEFGSAEGELPRADEEAVSL